MSKLFVAAIFSIFAVSCGGAVSPAPSGPGGSEVTNQRITNGTVSEGDTAVVMIRLFNNGAEVGFCSGVMLTSRLALTAAHCMKNGISGLLVSNETYPNNFVPAVGWAMSPNYVPTQGIGNHGASDIAIVVLEYAPGWPTRELYRAPVDWIGDFNRPVRVVGYGAEDASGQGAGVRRTGNGMIMTAEGGFVNLRGDSTQCYGDSGGPSFIDDQGVEKVLGVSSHLSIGGFCGDNWNALTSANLDFLDAHIAYYP